MAGAEISEREIQFFQTNGYLQIPHFFSTEEIKELTDGLDRTVEEKRSRILNSDQEVADGYNQVFNQLVNLWVDYGDIRKFTFNPSLAEIARKLSLCKQINLYHDHALIKPGGETSRETNWHQDAPYWPMEQVGALSAWIAADDVTTENGCMQFIPGSHSYGRLEPVPLATEGASVLKTLKDTGVEEEVEPVIMEMEAGGVTFHHGCTFHYATQNRTDKPRRAHAIIYMPDYITYNGRWDAGGADDLEAGKPFCGPQHPILATGN